MVSWASLGERSSFGRFSEMQREMGKGLGSELPPEHSRLLGIWMSGVVVMLPPHINHSVDPVNNSVNFATYFSFLSLSDFLCRPWQLLLRIYVFNRSHRKKYLSAILSFFSDCISLWLLRDLYFSFVTIPFLCFWVLSTPLWLASMSKLLFIHK